jgi:ubiquitin-like protein Pup
MSSQQYQPRPSDRQQPAAHDPVQIPARATASRDAYDAVLDEIDAVLERDAEAFVRGFVQKGGE